MSIREERLPLTPEDVFCPNLDCPARGRINEGNIGVHSIKERRFICHLCKKTFSSRLGTAFYRLRTEERIVTQVVTLLAHGCPAQAIVAAFDLDERTVLDWHSRAGSQAEAVQKHLVETPRDLGEVQSDELRVKAQGRVFWMATSIQVSTRLWLGGVVSECRDLLLISSLMMIVKACASALGKGVLFCSDGLCHYVSAIREVFREPHSSGLPGRPRLVAWPRILIAQVIKRVAGRRIEEVERRVVQGSREEIELRRHKSKEGGVLNTAFIERLNATFRQRLSCLARRTRALVRLPQRLHQAMYLVGTVYNFCCEHKSLRLPGLIGGHKWLGRTPAMAAGLTDHCWSVEELLTFHVPPPRWIPPKQRGRPSKKLKQLIERWC
jgi:transposase-like protein